MTMPRRHVLRGLGGLAATTALGIDARRVDGWMTPDGAATPATEFPRKGDFLIDEGTTYINAAYTHPIPKVSLEAVRRAAEGRCAVHAAAAGAANPRTLFAELINAKPTEIAYVSSRRSGSIAASTATSSPTASTSRGRCCTCSS